MPHCARWSSRTVRFTGLMPAVLVVDDHEASGEALTAALGAEAMDVRFASGGVQALEVTRNWIPDVVVLDINMPIHDGFSTARVLRRIQTTQDATIVAFTSLDEREVREKALISGFDGYCQKGQSPKEIVVLIQTMTRD